MVMKSIRNLIRGLIYESRMTTYTGQILSLIGKIPGLKRIGGWHMASGSVGLFRFEQDKYLYEIIVRPVDLGEFKDLYPNITTPKIERPSYNTNKEEPLNIQQVAELIKNQMSGSINKIKAIGNTKEAYKFKIFFRHNIKIDDINNAIKTLESFDYFAITSSDLDVDPKSITIIYNKLM